MDLVIGKAELEGECEAYAPSSIGGMVNISYGDGDCKAGVREVVFLGEAPINAVNFGSRVNEGGESNGFFSTFRVKGRDRNSHGISGL